MAAQPRASKSQARMQKLRDLMVVPEIKPEIAEDVLRARAEEIKFAPTCREIANLIHAYPGTTREPRLLFELLAPKADKADVTANHMLVVNKLTRKYGQTCRDAHWLFQDEDPEGTIEAYALRHFDAPPPPPRPAVSVPAEQPKEDLYLAKLKKTLRGVYDREDLRERAMQFKKPLTSQQLVALLKVYPGSCTWQAKFLFEHFAPTLSDKQKTYKKLVQKLKPMIYYYDLDEPYEAWVVRILDVDTSQSSVDVTPVPKVKPVKPVPPPEEEVPPSPLAVAPAAANPGDDA